MTLKYFFDTEFIDDGWTIDLISIGIVCEDGREYYAEVHGVGWEKASQWVLDNVRTQLTGETKSRAQIAMDILGFVFEGQQPPEFWAYFAAYDWVVLCQLYGTMMELPNQPPPVGQWPMFCMDLKQAATMLGIARFPPQEGVEHNALADAKWNLQSYLWLIDQLHGGWNL